MEGIDHIRNLMTEEGFGVSLPMPTYFTLEACQYWGDHVIDVSIEDAEENGFFAIHAGLPDRPDDRHFLRAEGLFEAAEQLTQIRACMPDAGIWLSCLEIQDQIKGPDLLRAIVQIRGNAMPDDDEDPWWAFSDHLANGKTKGPIGDWFDDCPDVIKELDERL